MKRLTSTLRRAAAAIGLLAAAFTAQAEVAIPVPPATLTEPADRASYIIMRFWDDADLSDNAPLEQDFVNFFSIAAIAPADSVGPAVGKAAKKVAATSRTADFADLAARYLLEKESPLFNEPLYVTLADSLLAYPGDDTATAARIAYLRDETAKGLPGLPAPGLAGTTDRNENFDLSLTSGTMCLLMFYDPDCDTCHEVLRQLMADPTVSGAITSGKLKAVAAYADDDPAAWSRSRGTFPTGWTNVHTPGAEERYAIPEVPTIYLIAPDGRVTARGLTSEETAAAIR